VLIIAKYARAPIKKFFSGKKEEMAQQIENIEKEKKAAEEKIKEAQDMLAEGKVRFAKLKQRIIEEGEKKKQKIVEDAQQESQILLESTHKKIDSQFLEARQAFKSELAEMAISKAMERLPHEINEEDNQKWSREYIASISQ
jgi:F-type H+-transporting ATPase subunit b